jgi:hypothetical protein
VSLSLKVAIFEWSTCFLFGLEFGVKSGIGGRTLKSTFVLRVIEASCP